MSTAESSRMTPSLWNFEEEAGEAAKKTQGKTRDHKSTWWTKETK